jgi:hypothetical protein
VGSSPIILVLEPGNMGQEGGSEQPGDGWGWGRFRLRPGERIGRLGRLGVVIGGK